MVIFGQSCCIRAKVFVFGQNGLYSVKRGCIRAKVDLFEQSGCILAKLLYSVRSACI